VLKTNTLERLQAVEAAGGLEPELCRDLRDAFEFLMLLRLERQMRQAREGQTPDNYLAPESLTPLQRSLLREAFQTAARAQALMEAKFRTAVWMQLGR
jgi:CBS domain-containing protein